MELDELKQIWNKTETFPKKNDVEILSMIRGSSKSVVSKLKRNVWIELIITIAAGLFLVYYFLTSPVGAYRWTCLSFMVLFGGYIVYYIKKLRLLHRFDSGQQSLTQHIQTLVNDLKVYLTFYRRSYTIVYPLYFFLGFTFTTVELGVDKLLQALSNLKTVIYLVLISGAFLACVFWLTNWYLNKLYGSHLLKLESLLKDIDQLKVEGQ